MKNKGISLIVLIITIVVIIILATAIIVSLSQTNIIGNANKATIMQDFKAMQDELMLYTADKFVETKGKFNLATFNANKETDPTVYDVIKSLEKSKYKDDVTIVNGKITIAENGSLSQEEIGWAIDGINGNVSTGGNNDSNINEPESDSSNENMETEQQPESGTNTNVGTMESALITNVDFEATTIGTKSLNLTINVSDSEVSNAAVYYAFCDGKVVTGGTSNQLKIGDLQADTTYTVKCGVIDVDGNIKISSEKTYKTEAALILYQNGEEYTDITGGWLKTGYSNRDGGTFTKYQDYMCLKGAVGSRIYCGTTNKIDLTGYSKLYAEMDVDNITCVISETDYYNNAEAAEYITMKNGELDISNYDGEYYIHFTVVNSSTNFTKIWLEQ